MSLHNLPRHRRVQLVIAALTVSFVAVLTGMVLYRSANKHSLLTGQSMTKGAGLSSPAMDSETESAIFIQDFQKAILKDGNIHWQVKARDAKYYANQGIAHLN